MNAAHIARTTLRFVLAAFAAGCFIAFGQVARGQDTGEIVVEVIDAATKTPVSFARVLLDGPVITNELSDPGGKVTFTDVPTGIYRARVGKNGYVQVTSSDFEVLDGKSVTVSVALAKSANVKTIGTVIVRSTATIGTSTIGQSSAVRKLSDTLADALNKLSSVTVSTDPNGASDASETISLEGHDPTQTMLSLDGIPLTAPGVAGDLRSINTDLFSGASVSYGPQAGALGGGVNFRTLEPTQTWQGQWSQSFGTYSKASTIVQGQGSLGALGVAFVHSVRGSDNPLDGMTFLDASGLDYTHQGDALTGGDMLKLRDRVDQAQTLTATFMSANNYDDLVCNRLTGLVPCGYGPGNFSFRHFSFESLNDSALIGQVGLQLAVYGTHSSFDRDLLDRFVNGVASPFQSGVLQSSRGASLSAILPSRERHTISIQASTTTSTVNVSSLVPSAQPFANGNALQSYDMLTVSDKEESNPQLTLTDHLGLSESTGSGSSILGGIGAAWNPTANDAYTGTLDVGGANPGPARVGVLSDPASLRFECDAGIAFGNGPGDLPGPSSSNSLRVNWQHRFATGQITTTLYRQVQNDVLVSTYVNGAFEPAGYFPANYFTLAQQIYQSPAGCGSSAPFGPSNLYITQPVANSRDLYEGVQLSGGFDIGHGLVAEPYYNLQVAKVLSGPTLLSNPASISYPGAQLPGVPLHRAGLTLDYHAPHSHVEELVDAQYVSGNNRQNLPSYVTTDAGAAIALEHGTLTLAATNIFNQHGVLFATPAGAVPYVTFGGAVLPTLAEPLSPRNYSITYAVKFGEGASSLPAASLLSAQAQASPGPRGGFFSQLKTLNDPVSASPLEPDTSKQSCSGDALAQAKPIFAALKAYVAAVDASKTAAGYPAAAPTSAPEVPGLAVAYHGLGAGYALAITPTQFSAVGALIRCGAVRVGTQEQAQGDHLFVPPATAFNRFPLAYEPGVGLYVARAPQQAGQEQFRLYRLPATPPAQPLAIVPSSRCSSDLKPTAAKMLAALQLYVTGFDPAHPPASQPPGWSVIVHPAGKAFWLELQPADISALPAVLNCAHVSAAAASDVKALGLDGARPPSLNFAPSVGLYMLRPQFGQERQAPPPQ